MEEKLFTKAQLKDQFGLTDSIIKYIPVTEERPNPMFRSAAPMKLYSEKTIEEFKATETYKSWLQKSEKRKMAAQKSVETRLLKNQEMLLQSIKSIKVKKLDNNKLVRLTLQAKNDWYDYQSDLRGTFNDFDPNSADKKTLDRWVVNYIRHNLTSYDDNLEQIAGKTGIAKLYKTLEFAVMERIASTYPQYREEVQRQLATKFPEGEE